MFRFLVGVLLLFTTLYGKSVEGYLEELKNLTDEQSAFLVAAYKFGEKYNLELTLTSIVWKESSFGRNLINKRDGKYGSFGLAQILLQTAISRNKINPKNKKAVDKLVRRLITDHIFNLSQAVNELLYWKAYYKDTKKSKWWYACMVGSYNAGWKTIRSTKGKEYYRDIRKRNAALKIFLKNKKYWKYFLKKYLGNAM